MQHSGSEDRQLEPGVPERASLRTDRDVTLGLVPRTGARRVESDICAWLVYERRLDDEAHNRLIFECPEIVRVVRTFPANWRELPDAELLAVSQGI